MITDRTTLVIDSYRDRRAASAHCALCGMTFRTNPDSKPDEAARHIYSAFCAPQLGCPPRLFNECLFSAAQ